ncbi:MAG: hypothetical protein LAO55_17335 [Acidobacteriia bacterium]|nr:hypothetical protein [Terriglobia bacterium]
MPGELDPLYVAARGVLLDALEALGPQRDAVILVGAQAIYLYTGAIELPIAEHTIDADVTLDPGLLKQTPEIESALTTAGFRRGCRVGAWVTTRQVSGVAVNIDLDLMVPEAAAGPGRRAARLAGHAKEIARKARGLEAALVDKNVMTLSALDTSDRRTFAVAVAGPAALLVSKLHKIGERLAEREHRRLDDKDALDLLRLLQAIPTSDLVRSFRQLSEHAVARDVTREALKALDDLFANAQRPGAQMAERAAGPFSPPTQIAESCAILTADLLRALEGAA